MSLSMCFRLSGELNRQEFSREHERSATVSGDELKGTSVDAHLLILLPNAAPIALAWPNMVTHRLIRRFSCRDLVKPCR